MPKILITGKSGFIGQALEKRLLSKYYNIQILDLGCDLRDHIRVSEVVINSNPDLIIHLAAMTEVEKSFYEQTSFSEVNYVGTINLIEAAKKCKNLKNLIFSSTMETYGWQPISDEIKKISYSGDMTDDEIYKHFIDKVRRSAFNETTIQNPNAPYAVAKMGCEKYLEYANRAYGLPYTYLRQTNAYGRWDNNFFVVEQIITQMLNNSDSISLGYKYPWRNFLYIEDLIDLYMILIDASFSDSAKILGGFCCGPNNAIPIFELVNIIAEKMRYSGKVVWDTKPIRPGEIYCLNSDNVKIHQHTGWSPKVCLSDGLDLTIKKWK